MTSPPTGNPKSSLPIFFFPLKTAKVNPFSLLLFMKCSNPGMVVASAMPASWTVEINR
ncbi:hypothetical protein UUU_15430 [Klebsiella pneumoniae subsp. pneumoniae DSM 30104 = JCM 1662 = NBRC 14940]|nr:hypothetical protein UUU_15430 [Klebsiella pneumoniae subsp. pneumoniae DSM 30104 = JCM 1662 = NBRC 14940]